MLACAQQCRASLAACIAAAVLLLPAVCDGEATSEQAEALALGADDECAASEPGACGLQALQLRGQQLRAQRREGHRLGGLAGELAPAPAAQAGPGSCTSYGCVGYVPAHACQCNSACKHHHNCCPDFVAKCGACAKSYAQDCRSTNKCCDKGFTCFEKDAHWAGCLESCTPGIHAEDPAGRRTAWSCKVLGDSALPTTSAAPSTTPGTTPPLMTTVAPSQPPTTALATTAAQSSNSMPPIGPPQMVVTTSTARVTATAAAPAATTTPAATAASQNLTTTTAATTTTTPFMFCSNPDEQCGGLVRVRNGSEWRPWKGATCCNDGYVCAKADENRSSCAEVSNKSNITSYHFAPRLRRPSDAPVFEFYMYRAESDEAFPPVNVNTANLPGVMWYLHNEIVGRADWGGTRKFGKTRIVRYKFRTRATQPLYWLGLNFGVRYAFDQGQCTGPYSCDKEWQKYGYFVGCNKMGNFTGWPFPNFPVSYEGGVWFSLPGPCPQMKYFQKNGSACRAAQPGGQCTGIPTGEFNCTYSYEKAGEISINELEGITDYKKFIEDGNLEYDRMTDRGTGMTFWNYINDANRSAERVEKAELLFEKHYPNSTKNVTGQPPCDFNFKLFYGQIKCHTAVPGDKCYEEMSWAKSDGIYGHPEWYPGLTKDSSLRDFQFEAFKSGGTSCPPPCFTGEQP